MQKQDILKLITTQINELKYQKVHLRQFIESDREQMRKIDFALNQLHNLYSQIENLETTCSCVKQAK